MSSHESSSTSNGGSRDNAFSGRDSLPNNPSGSVRSSLHDDDKTQVADVFDVRHRYPTTANIQRWKKATIVLNATRRFRYATRVEIDVLKQERLKKFRTSTYALRAARRFQEAAPIDEILPEGFQISMSKLFGLVQQRDASSLQRLGGIVGVARRLGTNLEKGIDDIPAQTHRRKAAFGENTYQRQPAKWFIAFLWDACKDLTLIILMVCAVLSLVFGIRSHGIEEGWYDGAGIAFAVLLVIVVTAVSDYKQALQFMELNELKRNIQMLVIRAGRRFKLSIFELVVGDVVVLSIGDQIPADGLLVNGQSVSVDESSMTGESEQVYVDLQKPFLLSGCKVVDGYGTMLVTAVGMNTEWGQLMAAIGEDTGEATPLQVRLNGVATFVGKVGLSVAVAVLVILIVFYFVGHRDGSNGSGKFRKGATSASDAVNSVVDIFSIAVTIIVVAVPEGLPLAVTLTLAYSMKKMMADRALVRRLAASETMGGANIICSDKTGTLTLNQMTIVKAWVAGEIREPVAELQGLNADVRDLLLEGIAQNSSGAVNSATEGGKPEVSGSPTEKAILSWGLEIGMDFEKVKSLATILRVETFNSTKKRASVVLRIKESHEIRIHWKGAAEMILHECHTFLRADNAEIPLTDETREHLTKVIKGMAAQSLRCISFGFRRIDEREVPTGEQLRQWEVPEGPLALIAIVGIKDPCRPGVRDAVTLCQTAGVKVKMITGDNLVTAQAIAAECGILVQGGVAIEGVEFRNYTDDLRRSKVLEISVMARSSPSDKLLLVRTLRQLGKVVAVTGDGTNDAPALHEADIGLAMGIEGTEVAKESADIIIMDDDFTSVVKVVRWGRSIYSNIQKFIQFQLTVNVGALTINFVAAVSSGDVPLTAVQLLWVNLIMDTLGALALATEPPTSDLMRRPPVDRHEPLISNVMARNILGQALYQVVVLLTLQFRGKTIFRLTGPRASAVNNTIIFNAFVLCQLFNEVNSRKPEELNIFRGLFNNWLFLGILATTLLLQVIIVEFLNKFASTVSLSWQQWLVCILIGSLSWPLGAIVKLIPVSEGSFVGRIKCWPRGRSQETTSGEQIDERSR